MTIPEYDQECDCDVCVEDRASRSRYYNRALITQHDRCEYLGDYSNTHCTINGDCNARTPAERAQRLCGVAVRKEEKREMRCFECNTVAEDDKLRWCPFCGALYGHILTRADKMMPGNNPTKCNYASGAHWYRTPELAEAANRRNRL